VVSRLRRRIRRVGLGHPAPWDDRFWPADGDWRYRRAVDLVLDAGRDVDGVAAELNIVPDLLGLWVDNARFNCAVLAEIEASSEGEMLG